MWELIGSLGAVPRRLIWDNETGISRRNSYAAGVAAFAGVLAARIVQVKPYDPESKGVPRISSSASARVPWSKTLSERVHLGLGRAPDPA
jgi:hypothetical protein